MLSCHRNSKLKGMQLRLCRHGLRSEVVHALNLMDVLAILWHSVGCEIMTCGETDPSVLDFMMQATRQYGFIPFKVLKESTGFIQCVAQRLGA